jgi:hypothetical protein
MFCVSTCDGTIGRCHGLTSNGCTGSDTPLAKSKPKWPARRSTLSVAVAENE